MRPGCKHEEGFQIAKDGLVFRWCSQHVCGAFGVKVAGEESFCWAQAGDGGEDQFQEILSSAKKRLRSSCASVARELML